MEHVIGIFFLQEILQVLKSFAPGNNSKIYTKRQKQTQKERDGFVGHFYRVCLL